MSHDKRPHQAGANSPGGTPYVLELPFFAGKLDIECFGKVLPQEVRRTRLQGLAVLHQCFNRVRFYRTGEAFAGRFNASDDRQRHVLFHEGSVDF